jgi:SAM-dependent methyltransferase
MEINANQIEVSEANAKFWDELCGSQLAKYLGIKDSSPESLKKFDDWYFDFYPYLADHIQFQNLKNKDVLEIGLGYGTVSQKLAESGARYRGLDIAPGPVNMVNHRLAQNGLEGAATQGSILQAPFESESFDAVVAIGCLHHTGDLRQAIIECHRLLRPGGRLIFMVYYAYSYRRWMQAPMDTIRYALSERKGMREVVGQSTSRHRAAYDKSESGEGAPHTDWISRKSLASLCSIFSGFSPTLENIDVIPPFHFWSRKSLMKTRIPHMFGLDLYAVATK